MASLDFQPEQLQEKVTKTKYGHSCRILQCKSLTVMASTIRTISMQWKCFKNNFCILQCAPRLNSKSNSLQYSFQKYNITSACSHLSNSAKSKLCHPPSQKLTLFLLYFWIMVCFIKVSFISNTNIGISFVFVDLVSRVGRLQPFA